MTDEQKAKQGLCKFILHDGDICGLSEHSTDSSRCRLHRDKVITSSRIPDLRDYIHARNRPDSICLHRLNYEGVQFGLPFVEELVRAGKSLIFNDSQFRNCNFEGCKFRGAVQFTNCTFENCQFKNCCFDGENSLFDDSTFFHTRSVFSFCQFRAAGVVSFNRVVIDCKSLAFYEVWIRAHEVAFLEATLNVPRFAVQFSEMDQIIIDKSYLVLAVEKASFAGIKVDGHFECKSISPEDLNGHPCQPGKIAKILFDQINFPEFKTATFFQANLEFARFRDANLEGVHFINAKWPEIDDRRILHEEMVLRERGLLDYPRLSELRRQYSQLKKAYGSNQDYIRAGQWYFRETECRRRMVPLRPGTGKLRKLETLASRSLFGAYRATSEYGESLVRPAILVLVALILFATVYFLAGFTFGKESIDYDLCLSCGISLSSIADYLCALLFSLSVTSLQYGRFGEGASAVSQVAAILQMICTAILVPLLLFAVRRIFKR